MQICIVTRSVLKGDGQGRANYEIVREALRRGYAVTLLATEVAPDLPRDPLLNWVYIPVKRYPTQLLSSLVFSRKSGDWLRKHGSEFDIVQAYGAVTSAGVDVNTVQFVHSAWLKSPAHVSRVRRDFYGFYQWLYTVLNAYWEKRAFDRTGSIVAVSEKIKEDLLDIGIPTEKIRVILNGADLDEFSPGERDRRSLGLPPDVPLALFVGDIRTNRKNLDTVLRALVGVDGLHLAVVGSLGGSPYPALAERSGVSDRVHFLDFRRDVADIMKAADLFVFPSRYEACTLVLLEAMASGLPAITATSAGGSEIVTPDCGVVLKDSEDVGALTRALADLVGDRPRRERMGRRAREIAEEHSWTSKARDYVDFFEGMVKC